MTSNPWVLVVDDDDDSLNVIVETLDWAGFDARGVSSATEALLLLDEADRPCAVLCDFMMPGLSGLDLFRQVRSDSALDDVAIVFVTAQLPALVPFPPNVPVLAKPFGDAALIAFVENNCPGAHRHAVAAPVP